MLFSFGDDQALRYGLMGVSTPVYSGGARCSANTRTSICGEPFIPSSREIVQDPSTQRPRSRRLTGALESARGWAKLPASGFPWTFHDPARHRQFLWGEA